MSTSADTGVPPPVLFTTIGEKAQSAQSAPMFHEWFCADGTPWMQLYRLGASYLLRFPGLADFSVGADGREVQAWAAPGVNAATVEHLYLNQVLPMALSRQGKLVIHASAVEVNGQCVAFVGQSGLGKSTLAASFATTGAGFLTDDGLRLEWQEGLLTAIPSHPSIRLWDDSRSALVGVAGALAPAVEYTSKARILAGNGLAFCAEPRTLAAIFFLGDGSSESTAIERVSPADALMRLVQSSFLLDIDKRELLAWHFDDISRIANLPLHYHLDYPRRYAALPQVRQAVLARLRPETH